MKALVCGLMAAVCVAPATAQQFMLSGAFSRYDDGDIDLDAVTGRGAFFFTPNIGVEGEFSGGPSQERLGDIPGVVTNLKVGLKTDYAAFLVGKFPINDRFQIFGRVGYGSTELEVEGTFPAPIGQQTGSDDVAGFRYGAGVLLNFTDEYGVRADYTRVEMDDDISGVAIEGSMNVYSLGLFLNF